MKEYTYVATCLLGLEGLVADELKFFGCKDVKAENGRVLFKGDFSIMARANIRSRYSERILLLLNEFKAYSFEELFNQIKNTPIEDFIGKNDKFPIKGKTVDSTLMSVPDCQRIIKKASVERLKSVYGIDWFEENESLYQLQFLIYKNRVSFMIDTTGVGLYKRGYRSKSNDAPIKETLAAAMADLSRVRSNHIVIDPMCGSGTILIESALKALNIAPGINRTFAFQEWSCFDLNIYDSEIKTAKEKENRDCNFKGIGYDIDPISLDIAIENAQLAGVSDVIEFAIRDLADFEEEYPRASVITNPPYGERMLNVSDAERLYKIMGKKFIKKDGWSYTIISPDDDFEKVFGHKADKRRKLYNGMLKCQVYMYFKK